MNTLTSTDFPSPSALRVAMARAAHQILDDERVFDDPFAIATLGPAAAATLLLDPYTHNDTPGRSLRAGIVARSRMAEDRLMRAVAAGCRQCAMVGAGLDTWALRAAMLLPSIDVFEIDQPRMQAWKRALYAANRWSPPGLKWVPADLRESGAVDALVTAGVDRTLPLSVSILGVMVYLEAQRVEQEIAALSALAAGSTVVLDYRLDDGLLPPMELAMMQFTARLMAAGGEPWLSSATPRDMRELLEAAGFEVEEDLGPADLNARYYARRRDGLQLAGGGFRYLSAVKVG